MTELEASGREALERYKVILQNIRDAVYTLDANGRITWVNPTAVEEFDIGYDREELIGAPVSKVLDESDIEKAVTIIQSLLEDDDRSSGRCEISIHTAHGTEIPCDLRLALLPFDDGEFQGTVGVLRDISDRKQREQRLTVFNRVLRHNLRNEMSLILGPAERLVETLEGPPRKNAERIRERAERLLGVAEKARQIEETIAHHDRERVPVDVASIVDERVAGFEEEYPDARISRNGPQEQWALANESLSIAIEELLENAIVHNDEPVQVSVSISTATDSSWVRIAIEDNGPAIPDDEIAVIEDGDESPLKHGSGLGLWFVRWLVEHYDGRLSFDRPADGGNIVTVELQPAPAVG